MGYFRMLVEYLSGSPDQLPNKPQEHQGTQPRKPTICPHCKPQNQKFISFCPIEVSQNTEETLDPLKNYLVFAPFQPISAPFAPVVRSSGSPRESRQGSPAPPNKTRNTTGPAAPMVPELSANQDHKTRRQGTRKGKGAT